MFFSSTMRKAYMKRDLTPDVLRGFALLGILLVNIQFMALSSEFGARGVWVQGIANSIAAFILFAVFQGKFYLIFSFLFGYSAGYIVRKQRANRPRWIKRCIVLMMLGVLHFSLLWHGDIIFLYGLFGLLLVPFLFRTEKTLSVWSYVLYGVFTVLLLGLATALIIDERVVTPTLPAAMPEATLDGVLRGGSYLDSIAPRIEMWMYGISGGLLLQGGFVFAAFLMGLRLARTQFLSLVVDAPQNNRMIRRGLVFGLPLQILAAAIFMQNEYTAQPSEAVFLAAIAVTFVAAPLLSMAYIGIMRKLVAERPAVVAWLAPAGRMSLTMYISQSVVTSLIFGPWGLGLFQEVAMWLVMLIAILVWLVLIAVAQIWLRTFTQGPLEWCVHAITKDRRAPTPSAIS
jgi:uncharacterized protein